jgi:hypothetical protein
MSTNEIPDAPEGTSEPEVENLAPVDDSDPIEGDDPEDQSESTPDNVRQLLPVHAAPKRGAGGGTLKVTRQRGRPRKVETMPTTSDLEYHGKMSEEKAKFITEDPVVIATSGKIDAPDLLRKLRSEIAKEAAALHFQRIENEKFGRDTSQTSTRRIDALTKIAHIELEINKIGPGIIDVRSEKFQRVIKLFIEFIQEAAAETMQPETLNLFFNCFETKMTGWEDKAEDALR